VFLKSSFGCTQPQKLQRAAHTGASRTTYRGAQLAIAAKWCYVVYNHASYKQKRGARETQEAHGSRRGRAAVGKAEEVAVRERSSRRNWTW
jgi:hypothetical protein